MHSPSLPIHLAHLENIDPAFLDPSTSFVVMPETTESDLDDARLALEGLSCMLDSMANHNVNLRQTGQVTQYVELPPDALSALLRLVSKKIAPARNNPTLSALRHVRPDLFNPQGA